MSLRLDYSTTEAQRQSEAFRRKVASDTKSSARIIETALGAALGIISTRAFPAMVRGLEGFLERSKEIGSVERSYHSLAGAAGLNADVLLNRLGPATLGQVDKLEQMRIANQAMNLGIVQNEEDFGRLAGAAVRLGRSMGQDVKGSLDAVIGGLGRQSFELLDNIGVSLRANEAYRIYAERLGTTAEKLTDAEKKTAFITVATERIIAKAKDAGEVVLTLGDRWDQATTFVGNALDMFVRGVDDTDRLRDAVSQLFATGDDAETTAAQWATALGVFTGELIAVGFENVVKMRAAIEGMYAALPGAGSDLPDFLRRWIVDNDTLKDLLSTAGAPFGGGIIAGILDAASRSLDTMEERLADLGNTADSAAPALRQVAPSVEAIGQAVTATDRAMAGAGWTVNGGNPFSTLLEQGRGYRDFVFDHVPGLGGILSDFFGKHAEYAQGPLISVEAGQRAWQVAIEDTAKDQATLDRAVEGSAETADSAFTKWVSRARAVGDVMEQVFGVNIPSWVDAAVNALDALVRKDPFSAIISGASAVIGLLGSLFGGGKSAFERELERVAQVYENVTGDLAENIARYAAAFGSYEAHIRFIGQILKAEGIPNAQAFYRELFNINQALERHYFDEAADAIGVMVDNLDLMELSAVDAWRAVIEGAREAGLEIAALDALFEDRLGNMSDAVSVLLDQVERSMRNIWVDLPDPTGHDGADEDLLRGSDQWQPGSRAIGNFNFAAQTLAFGIQEALAQGFSTMQIEELFGGNLDRIVALADELGFELPDILTETNELLDLLGQRHIARLSSEINAERAIIESLIDVGLKPTQAMFKDFVKDLRRMIFRMQTGGASQEDILLAFGPQIMTALELMRDFGLNINRGTLELFAQAGVDVEAILSATSERDLLQGIHDDAHEYHGFMRSHARANENLLRNLRGDIRDGFRGIRRMATGGIVTEPTLAVVGEAGPEAVLPLGGMGFSAPSSPAPAVVVREPATSAGGGMAGLVDALMADPAARKRFADWIEVETDRRTRMGS